MTIVVPLSWLWWLLLVLPCNTVHIYYVHDRTIIWVVCIQAATKPPTAALHGNVYTIIYVLHNMYDDYNNNNNTNNINSNNNNDKFNDDDSEEDTYIVTLERGLRLENVYKKILVAISQYQNAFCHYILLCCFFCLKKKTRWSNLFFQFCLYTLCIG